LGDPSVHAVVVNWNGRELLEPCLRTLLASRYANLSVTVVDNASTDGSREFVAEEFPQVRLVANDENLGYAAGANAGLAGVAAEGGDFALLMNNDTEVDPDAVASLVEAAREHPRAAFVGPMIYYHDRPDVIWSAGGRISYWTGDVRHVGIRERDRGQYDGVRDVDYVTACAVLVAVKPLGEIGMMDASYFMYNEDTDWCVRAAERGYAVLVAPRAKVWHKVSMSSGGGLTSYKIYHRFLSTFRFFRRHARPYHWIGIAPAVAARAVGFVVGELLRGRPANAAAVFRGVGDTLRGRRAR
jgi:GT2 family glycosyltransferase